MVEHLAGGPGSASRRWWRWRPSGSSARRSRRSGAGVRAALVALEAGHEALEAGRPADLEGATRALARARGWLETLAALTSDPAAGGGGG